MESHNRTIRRYSAADRELWDNFVRGSRNGTFLFQRGYMEYHADRFDDFSLMVFDEGDRLCALLPANRVGDTLRSHGGLTYGGWILPFDSVDAGDVMALFDALKEFCRAEGIGEVLYKAVPHIYHRRPSQEDLYALWRLGAERTVCNISCTIEIPADIPFARHQRKYLRQAGRRCADMRFVELNEAAPVVRLIEECLCERHNSTPTHNAAELQTLRDRFPENIRFYGLESASGLEVAGCIFLTDTTAHAQYIDTSARARRDKALTLMVSELLARPEISARRYFDFGTSNEDNGRILNSTLYSNKFSFGGGGVAYEQYLIKI